MAPCKAPQGGSDPETLFGRLKAEKVGSLPPVSVLFWLLLFGPAFRYLVEAQTMRGHKRKAWVQRRLQGDSDLVFTGFPLVPAGKRRRSSESLPRN